MSGGSYDYVYYKVQGMADSLRGKGNSALRRAFAKHLDLVASAMHDIEWVDSGDYGKGDDENAIRAVLESTANEREILYEDAKELVKQLQALTPTKTNNQ